MTVSDLTILILARNEAENLQELLPNLRHTMETLAVSYEVIVVDGRSTDETASVVQTCGARVITQVHPGYGNALKEGIRHAQGRYILTMDADLSHEPAFIAKLWANRMRAEVVIASRYIRGGVAYMPWFRKVLSQILNRVFTRGLALEIRDISSGFRLYHAAMLKTLQLEGAQFDILPEIAVRAHSAGWRVLEVPFTYFPRHKGYSQARIIRVGINLGRTFLKMWGLRNSIEAADYDERAFYSWIPMQRLWQRRRHRIITTFARRAGRTLDVGCGSSVILQSLNHAVGMDLRHTKMRYMARYGAPVVTGSLFALPFADRSMDCVISSEVIEHVPASPAIFTELDRVLKPGGLLILGTPDYSTVTWPIIEQLYHVLAPGGYACEHIAHYTRAGIERLLQVMGYHLTEARYVFGSELIVAARKSTQAVPPAAEQITPLLPHDQAHAAARGLPSICMLATKFYASSDMGGGLERSARRLTLALRQSGHRVTVLTRNYDGLPRREEIDGAMVERFPIWGRSRLLTSLSYLVQSLWWLIRHRREYDVIHCHQSYAPATIGVLAKLLLRKPVLVKISTADEFSERRELERLPLFGVRRLLLRRVDRFVAVNRLASGEFADLGIGAERITHIPNGVVIPSEAAFEETAKTAARERLGLGAGSLAVFVGRLSMEKNLSALLEAWSSVIRAHPGARLLVVGDGGTFRNVEADLRRQAHALGLQDRVVFTGRVAHVLDYLLASDLFVLPSITEGMSNALLEAMAAGLPAVASRVPGNEELIQDQENGLLVDAQDPDALAHAVCRLFADPTEAHRLGQAARRTVEERFTIERVARAYLDLYHGLLGNGGQQRL